MKEKKRFGFGQAYEAPHAESFGFENESSLLSSSQPVPPFVAPDVNGFSNEGFTSKTGGWGN